MMDLCRIVVPLSRKLWNLESYPSRLNKVITKLISTKNGQIKCNQYSVSTIKREPPWNIMFFGTDEFAVQSLAALHECKERGVIGKLDVVTIALKKASPVQKYCTQKGLDLINWPLEVPSGIYDVGTVVSFGHLLPPAVIDAFPLGILNVHGSLLPRWRGAAPIIHAMLNNDQVTGVTIMKIEPFKFDVGCIVSTTEVEIHWDMKSGELTKQLASIGARELSRVIEHLPQALNQTITQPSEGVTKAPKVTEATSKISWNIHTGCDIQVKYRALDDHFPLWTTWQGKTLKLRDMVMHREWSPAAASTSESRCKNDDSKNVFGKKLGSDIKNDHSNHDFKNIINTNSPNVRTLPSCKIEANENNSNVNLKVENTEFGMAHYDKKTKILYVKCADNFVGFRQVILKGRKQMSAHEFYNGFLGKVPSRFWRFC